jgi:predicted secreted hydrolase
VRQDLAALSFDLAVEAVALFDQQDLRISGSTQASYWEGAVSVVGTNQGWSVKGQRYVELTAYAERINRKP